MFTQDDGAESAGEVDGDPTVALYRTSRARYIRTVTSGVEERLRATIGKRREPLMEEIANLALLAHSRYETYQDALRAYAVKLPGHVTAAGIVSPSAADRMIGGVDKLYKAAIKAADEFREVDAIVKKRKAKLADIDWQMRTQIEQYGRALVAQLETPSGLKAAFERDPLLGRAHGLMQAAHMRRTTVLTTTPR